MNIQKLHRLLKAVQTTQDNETRERLINEITRELRAGNDLKGLARLKRTKHSWLFRTADIAGRICFELAKHQAASDVLDSIHAVLKPKGWL